MTSSNIHQLRETYFTISCRSSRVLMHYVIRFVWKGTCPIFVTTVSVSLKTSLSCYIRSVLKLADDCGLGAMRRVYRVPFDCGSPCRSPNVDKFAPLRPSIAVSRTVWDRAIGVRIPLHLGVAAEASRHFARWSQETGATSLRNESIASFTASGAS